MEDNKMLYNSLGLYIDGKFAIQMEKNKKAEIEVTNGKHEITIMTKILAEIKKDETLYKDTIWANENIECDKDLYFLFKAPVLVNGKGKLINVDKEKFEKKLKSGTFWSSKTGVILSLILACIILIILKFL